MVANGDNVPIAGSESIQIKPYLLLHNVLHVPKLANSLFPIHKVIRDLNCSVTSFHSHYVLQDLATRKTILIAKEQGGLYFLEHKKIHDQNQNLPSSQQVKSDT